MADSAGGAGQSSRNPLLLPASEALEFGYPRFDELRVEHFAGALSTGMTLALEEIQAICAQTAAPDFENTVAAFDAHGSVLSAARLLLGNLTSAHSSAELEAVERGFAAILAAHDDAVLMHAQLYSRLAAVEVSTLAPEQRRLTEHFCDKFRRAGAALAPAAQLRVKAINQRLAALETGLAQRVKRERALHRVIFKDEAALDGLSAEERAAARTEDGCFAFELLSTTGHVLLTKLKNRESRASVFQASTARGSSGGEGDTRADCLECVRLRHEKANLLGFKSYAAYVAAEQTIKTPEAVESLLRSLTRPVMQNAQKELEQLQSLAQELDGPLEGGVQAHDFAYYMERLRAREFNFDVDQLKPYLLLQNVVERGLFLAATRMYGIFFHQRSDLPLYHSDCQTFDVIDQDGSKLGILIMDYFARPEKNGGAWMTLFTPQDRNQRPVVSLCLNVQKPQNPQAPVLMNWVDVEHAFHEFGHALHGLLSDVTYRTLCSPAVPTDFVEYPSQVNEIWYRDQATVASFATHWQTNKCLDQTLIEKMTASANIDVGFTVLEYLQCAVLDFELHARLPKAITPAELFPEEEREIIRNWGLSLPQIPPRYHLPYFLHTLAGGYSSLYWAYCWSQVLDAHTEHWIKTCGNSLRDCGDKFRELILSRGNSADPLEQFAKLVGESPKVEHYLRRRNMLL